MLKSFLCSPETQSPLSSSDENFLYFGQEKYPIIKGVPVLVQDPELHLMKTYQDVMNYIRSWIDRRDSLLSDQKKLPKKGQKKIEHKVLGIESHLKEIEIFMNESIIDFFSEHYETKDTVDDNETLNYVDFIFQYSTNFFRDWFWETEENSCYADMIGSMGKLEGKALVLGTGAGRFSYDLAAMNSDLEVIGTDLNLFALLLGNGMNAGKKLNWTHLPKNPSSLENCAKKFDSISVKPLENLLFINNDFRDNSIQAMSFDYVFAPWFCDVLKIPFSAIINRLNYFLKNSGKLIYCGPYSFEKFGESYSYTPEEIEENICSLGFRKAVFEQREVPYLKDPSSCQFRMEKIIWGIFEKTNHQKFEKILKNYHSTPEWLEDHNRLIPLVGEVRKRKEIYDTFNGLYAEIDGEKSLKKLAKAFAKKKGISPAQAKAIILMHFEKVF